MAGPAESSSSSDHDPVGAWFLGPKSENARFLEDLLVTVLRDYVHWRRNYFPADRELITPSRQRTLGHSFDEINSSVTDMMAGLRRNFPFYSPRYFGHQLSDTTIASLVGHFAGTLYNPNNVTPEAAPVTVHWEIDACAKLLEMIGYEPAPSPPRHEGDRRAYAARLRSGFGWAHITSGGTLANIEALWAARAVGYFPLAARDVARKLGISLYVKLPSHDDRAKPDARIDLGAKDVDEYELLLLKPYEKIYLLARLVDAIAHKENLAAVEAGARTAEMLRTCERSPSESFAVISREFPARILAPVTAHYSIEKAADLLGIGRINIVDVRTDRMFRLDPSDLARKLESCYRERVMPLAVVAIVGTTEEGAIDPVDRVVDLRRDHEQRRDASFWLHVDGAWGGYFRSLFTLTERATLDATAMKFGGTRGLPEECEPNAWLAATVQFVRDATDTMKLSEAELNICSKVLRACEGAVTDAERVRTLRAMLIFASKVGILPPEPGDRDEDRDPTGTDAAAGEVNPGPSGRPLDENDFDLKLYDWVEYVQRTVSERIVMPYGKFQRELYVKYGDKHICSALLAVPQADSVVVDPHKMGYIGYPCGVVAFRNDRVRHFLMQDAPYITEAKHSALLHQPPRHSDDLETPTGDQRVPIDAFAPFTLEGSRPGASAVSLWLSTNVTPPNVEGHGRLVRASALAGRELYEWIRLWQEVADANAMEPEYDVMSYTEFPPDTNIVIFAVKKKTSSSLATMNALTKGVYDAFTIQPELGERDYSYSQPFFVSHTTFKLPAYPYACVEPFLIRAGVRAPRSDYATNGLNVLRASVMSPYIAEMRRRGTQYVFRDFMDALHQAATAAVTELAMRQKP